MQSAEWALVQYRRGDGGAVRTGILADGKVLEAPGWLGDHPMLEVLRNWDDASRALRAWTPRGAAVVPDAALAAPLTYPAKIVCAGANYYSHAGEMGTARPDPAAEPFFFFKPPTTTVIGPGDPIPLPANDGAQVDWEAELGVVIGHRVRDVSPGAALDHVAGYVVANDVSARDRLARADAVAGPFAFDWVGSKAQDGFCPLGPGMVPAWLVPDPQALRLRLTVNGVTKQDQSTADMVVPVDRLVAAASRLVTLEPGDVILTGTPAGVGLAHGEFLAPGDEVAAEIEGIGALRNPVVRR
jgi:2-keto-4-pentenoate hydratase/2-oxohepta-3-ene-1,7-dioic acid hydratase in catechol pathway